MNSYKVIAILTIALLLCMVPFISGDVAKHDYAPHEIVPIQVNKLISSITKIPYKYYDLPFCQPTNIEGKKENMGEILAGDRIENALYNITALDNIECAVLNNDIRISDGACKDAFYTNEDLVKLAKGLEENYHAHWIIDNLPASTLYGAHYPPAKFVGYPIGVRSNMDGQNFLCNHISIKLLYNAVSVGKINIVGFEVIPNSYQYDVKAWRKFYDKTKCPENLYSSPQSIIPNADNNDGVEILWTYDVIWEQSDITWNNRWDAYFRSSNYYGNMHTTTILVVILFVVVVTLVITLGLIKYNQKLSAENNEETGWKLLHGDVFRAPSNPMVLSVLIGSGVQVLATAMFLMVFCIFGQLSASDSGSFLTTLIYVFVIMGFFGGFSSTYCYKIFGGSNWIKNTIMTAFAFPSIVFVFWVFVAFRLLKEKSSASVPLDTFGSIVGLWIGVCVPLVCVGSYLAFKRPVPENPVKTNQIPRQIPQQKLNSVLLIFMGGFVVFGTILVEYYFISFTIWHHQPIGTFIYVFFVITLLFASIEVSLLVCYLKLCTEDYNWWWRSFLSSGLVAFYAFLYSILVFMTETYVDIIMFISYTFIIVLSIFVLAGAVGFLSSYVFVRNIYASLKVD